LLTLAKIIKMAKQFKGRGSKDFKGKKSFAPKRDKEDSEKPSFNRRDKEDAPKSSRFNRKDDNDFAVKSSDSSKERSDKRDSKPGFERYRDDSKPSDFGTGKKRRSSSSESYNKPDRSSSRSSSRNTEERKGSKPFKKKPFSKSAPINKSKAHANPYDLDEADFEYGKPKTNFDKPQSKEFKKRGYEKKPYEKKTWPSKKSSASKPQRTVDDGMMRLNKFIANAGICSRREADDLITSGVVQVNGKTITEMGYRIKPTDIIKYGGQTLKKERMVYLILNKPKDYITTADDPQQRKTVLELIQGACKERIYPVGRLDRATTGLLMFTNDGDLTKKLTHPKYGVRKIYHVQLDKPLKRSDLDQIAEGIELEDGPIKVDQVTYVGDGTDKTEVGVEIHSGKNRIVRRIFEHMGYNVRKLDRVMFGSLTKKDLPRGRWRILSDAEVGMLKMISAE
jgi:23S rRNA pseudouridine2605 synthase